MTALDTSGLAPPNSHQGIDMSIPAAVRYNRNLLAAAVARAEADGGKMAPQIDAARRVYLDARRPKDLITLKEAAALVDRSVTTIRKWVKTGALKSTPHPSGHKKKGKLVSRADLMIYVAASGKSASPGRRASAKNERSRAVLMAELNGQQALVGMLEQQLELLRTQITFLKEANEHERERAEEWKDRSTALKAELTALRSHMGMSWWRKLLTTTAPMLDPSRA